MKHPMLSQCILLVALLMCQPLSLALSLWSASPPGNDFTSVPFSDSSTARAAGKGDAILHSNLNRSAMGVDSNSQVSEKLVVEIDSASLLPNSLKVSADSRRVAYAAKSGDKEFIVVDDKAEKGYDYVTAPVFSLDGKRVAYYAKSDDKEFAVVDREEGEKYDLIEWPPIFSADGSRFAYCAGESGFLKSLIFRRWSFVVDGKEDEQYDTVYNNTFCFSHDGKHYRYGASSAEKRVIWVEDGKEIDTGRIADSAYGPTSPKQYNVVDEKEKKRYHDIGTGSLQFSPDGKRFAYTAKSGDGQKRFVIVDGKEEKRYDEISKLNFSPDGKLVAYAAKSGDKWFVVVDGKEEKQYDSILGTRIIFDTDSSLHYLAQNGNKIYLVEESF